jgi:hypothetical protein
MSGLNYMPAGSTRAAIKTRGLRHHPDGSSSKNYSVSEVGRVTLFKFKKYFLWRATVIGSDTLVNTIGIARVSRCNMAATGVVAATITSVAIPTARASEADIDPAGRHSQGRSACSKVTIGCIAFVQDIPFPRWGTR